MCIQPNKQIYEINCVSHEPCGLSRNQLRSCKDPIQKFLDNFWLLNLFRVNMIYYTCVSLRGTGFIYLPQKTIGYFVVQSKKYFEVCPSTFWCHCMPISYILSILSLILFSSSQEVQHNCQLHRISFCADDKTDKRIFTFICKDSESNKHLCYVFDSEKCVRHDLKKLFVILTYCFGTFTSNLNGYLNVAQKTNGQTKHC